MSKVRTRFRASRRALQSGADPVKHTLTDARGRITYFTPQKSFGKTLLVKLIGRREFFMTSNAGAGKQMIQITGGSIGAAASVYVTTDALNTASGTPLNSCVMQLNFNAGGTAPNFSNAANIGYCASEVFAGYERWIIQKVKIRLMYEPITQNADYMLFLGALSPSIASVGRTISNGWSDFKFLPGFVTKMNYNQFVGGGTASYSKRLSCEKSFKLSTLNPYYKLDPYSYGGTMTSGATATDPGSIAAYVYMGVSTRDGSNFPINTQMGSMFVTTEVTYKLFERRIDIGQ